MATYIGNIKLRGSLGADLRDEDWRILLEDAEAAGSLQAVLIALTKLDALDEPGVFENLLCTAIIAGDADTAFDTCKHIGRRLLSDEESILIENIVVTGNVKGFIAHIDICNREMKALFHTTIAIAVCRFLHKKDKGNFPVITLTTWLRLCHKEFGSFRAGHRYVPSKNYPGAILVCFGRQSLGHFAGALLMEGIISREDFRFIIK